MRNVWPMLLTLLAVAGFVWSNQHNPFFWDTVQLGSKHAHFFYENGLQWAPLPSSIDSGHPPVFGWLLAACWTLFGKTLPVSHWMMFPFLAGIAMLLWYIGKRLGGLEWAPWLLPLVLLDPVLAGQSALVSPDVVLAFGFLLSVSGLMYGKRWWVMLGILGLCSVSMRGMMTAGALFVFGNCLAWSRSRKDVRLATIRYFFQTTLPFLPGFLFAAWFLWWHQKNTGWTGFHPDSPWATAFKPVGMGGMLRNAAIIGWRWTDLGRFAEWLLLFILLFRRRKFWLSKLFWLWVILVAFLTPSALLYQNLSAHRYFLPAFIALHLLVFQLVANSDLGKLRRKLLYTALIACLATGSLWIYPRGISMDWDATLAHLPYHRLQSEAIRFLDKENIDFQTVGSAFPNLNTGENLLLNGDGRRFAELDLSVNAYVLTSNVFNDIDEDTYRQLEKEWQLVRRQEMAGVWMELYRRK
ncbi:MAG: hypothetical protein IT259_15835 [Saprospiraceae bacterium]|nr:hypothetical protein [Saprospiraceae bacterium]